MTIWIGPCCPACSCPAGEAAAMCSPPLAAEPHPAGTTGLCAFGVCCRCEFSQVRGCHRYPMIRAQADLLSQYAEDLANEAPGRAMEILERARLLDPDVEETYVRIMRLRDQMARFEAVT
ncbi:hypothetical protein [Nonomuraea sp. NPDC050691]|uniref:hypothetical protein n=1 Tax=Nonomuraea sp. NPDC050691 TaxID=3155661 RepID=UPI0034097B29